MFESMMAKMCSVHRVACVPHSKQLNEDGEPLWVCPYRVREECRPGDLVDVKIVVSPRPVPVPVEVK